MIGLQRRGPVPGQGLQLQQGAVADLFERLQFDPLPGPFDRVLVCPGRPVHRDQLVEQGQAPAVQPVALGGHPVVVQRGQQLAAVGAQRAHRRLPEPGVIAGRPCGGGGTGPGFELGHVQPAARPGPP